MDIKIIVEKLIEPFEKLGADFVLGSRFRSEGYRRVIYFSHELANKFLTFICNLLLNKNFTDIETGYKVFRKNLIDKVNIERDDFGIEIEILYKSLPCDERPRPALGLL